MKLTFRDQKCLLADVNPRSEIHGEERAPAADLKLSCDVANDVLDQLHPALKTMLYYFDTERPADLVDQGKSGEPGYLPHLRIGGLVPPLKWGEEAVGCKVIIGNGQRQIVLQDSKVNAVQFEPRDGGTVHLSVRVQCHPDEGALGALSTWIQQEVQLTLSTAEE